jgi:peptidoglycan/xylan/chitin deacetylase (PgdA/CDA1 family)
MNDFRLRSRRIAKSVFAKTVGPFLGLHQPVVLGYHRVVERYDTALPLSLPGSLISVAMLERHLDAIGRRYEFVSLDDLTRPGNRRRAIAAVTFDDGYEDVYHNAVPLLIRKGIPAAIFVVTDLVGTTRLHAHDLLYSSLSRLIPQWSAPRSMLLTRLLDAGIDEDICMAIVRNPPAPLPVTRALLTSLSREQVDRVLELLQSEANVDNRQAQRRRAIRSLTWDMVLSMHRAGFTIGSHTCTHALLTNETRDRVQDEVTASRHALEDRLQSPVSHFAYPDGRFNSSSLAAVDHAGYQFAYTTCPHRDPVRPELTIPRRVLWEYSAVDSAGRFSAAIMHCQASGWLIGKCACTWQSHT